MAAFRRWVPTLATIVVVAVCVWAGNWQRARMHYKQDLRARYEAAAARPPLAAPDLPQGDDAPASRYRSVAIEGTFDGARQFLLDNRVRAGVVGYEVVAPLRLADGRIVLVDRGWVAQGRTRAVLPDVAPPAGAVTVRGRIEIPPSHFFSLAEEQGWKPVWQHLDLRRFRELTGLAVVPVVIQQTASAAAGDHLDRTWPAPDFGIDTHRIYMAQWYAFAVIALVFWGVAHRPRRRVAVTESRDA